MDGLRLNSVELQMEEGLSYHKMHPSYRCAQNNLEQEEDDDDIHDHSCATVEFAVVEVVVVGK